MEEWKERLVEEYTQTKERYNKLHAALVRREAGVLDFEPMESLDIWKRQASAMGNYLYILELRMVVNSIPIPKV